MIKSSMTKQGHIIGVIALITVVLGIGLWTMEPRHAADAAHAAEAPAQFERGPHRGRLLRDGDFALEVTIFEDSVPPEFHLYAYDDNKVLKPQEFQASVTLGRLDGESNAFRFAAVEDYLRGDGVVHEPHSFDVVVTANYKGKAHKWSYASYEGRTTIDAKTAAGAGVVAEPAGPGVIANAAVLTGRIALDPGRSAQVRARFPGIVREVRKTIGDTVQAGDVLAVIESNESLQPYQVRAPIAGHITGRAITTGEMSSDRAIFEVADTRHVVAEFNVFPRHFAAVKEGQPVTVRALEADMTYDGKLDVLATVADPATQTIIARMRIDNAEGVWRPGMTVTGRVVTAEREAPLTVKNSGLQAFRDLTVVFAKVGNTYEVRMLELGESDGTVTEVLGGLKPGTQYVSENSFLIKADIEKSGASHDH